MLHLPETSFYSFPLSQSLMPSSVTLLSCRPPPPSISLSVCLCLPLFFSFPRLVGLFLPSTVQTGVCVNSECVWEPDRVRVREWAGPAQCRGFLYDDVRGEEPSPSSSLLSLPSSPISSLYSPLLPCAWPRLLLLLLEHRKGGREIIGRTAANK